MLVALLAIAGVLAAIAVPAHYDRVYRSQVALAVGTVRPFRPRVDGDTLLWSCTGGTLASRYRVHSCR